MKRPMIVLDATSEPLTLAEARLQCRVDPIENLDSDGNGTHPDDDLLEALVSAARQYCENYLGMSIVPKTLEIALDEFPTEDDGAIELPMGPVNAIVSVTVGEESDALMDPADYVLDQFSFPNRILPAVSWPTTTASLNTIRIVYLVGYDGPNSSDGPAIPKNIIQAMKLLVGDWYKNREDSSSMRADMIPNGAYVLLSMADRERRGFA